MKADEDLASAVSYVFQNADMLEVGTEGYSLWGSSAGARMVGDIALNGVAYYGGLDIPKPGLRSLPIPDMQAVLPGFLQPLLQ